MRRVTSIRSESLNAAGAVRLALSSTRPTSALLRAGPVAGAGEDHVVHAGRAHVLVRILAHDPAQGLDEVGLAATVRFTTPASPGSMYPEFGRLDEALEPDEPKFVESHS